MALIGLAACQAVGPDYRAPADTHLPDHYLEPDGMQSLAAGWQAIAQDAEIQTLLRQAQADNPDLGMALARLAQARAVQAVQDAGSGPVLNLGAQDSSDRISRDGELFANMPPSPNLKSQFVSAQFGFDASWEIDLFGYQRRISEGAQARSEAMQAHVHDARLSLQAEVVRNALEWRVGQQRLQLARVQLAQLDDQLQMTQAARKAGEATQQDLLRSQTLRDSFAATLPLLELGARQSLAALSTLTAVPVQTLEAQLHDVRLPDVPAPPSAGVPAELLRNRPDIRASERDLAGASADVGVAVAAQYPRLSLSGNAGWNAIQTHALFDGRSEFWSLGPKLNLPLFNSGRLREQVKANEAALDVAKAGYRKTLVGALADVEVALARMSRNETRRQQMLQLQAQQDEVLRLTQVQFDAGEVARSSLVEAQRGLVNAQDQSLQAQGQSLAAWVALYKALGGTQ